MIGGKPDAPLYNCTIVYPTQQSSSPSGGIPSSHKQDNDSGITVSSGMEEMPSQNMSVQRLKLAILPLDLPFCGLVTHSGEILTTGKSHKKKPNGLLPTDESNF